MALAGSGDGGTLGDVLNGAEDEAGAMGLSDVEAPEPLPVAAVVPGSAELPLLDAPPVAPGALFCAEEHTAHAKTITAQDICLCHRIWPPRTALAPRGRLYSTPPSGAREDVVAQGTLPAIGYFKYISFLLSYFWDQQNRLEAPPRKPSVYTVIVPFCLRETYGRAHRYSCR